AEVERIALDRDITESNVTLAGLESQYFEQIKSDLLVQLQDQIEKLEAGTAETQADRLIAEIARLDSSADVTDMHETPFNELFNQLGEVLQTSRYIDANILLLDDGEEKDVLLEAFAGWTQGQSSITFSKLNALQENGGGYSAYQEIVQKLVSNTRDLQSEVVTDAIGRLNSETKQAAKMQLGQDVEQHKRALATAGGASNVSEFAPLYTDLQEKLNAEAPLPRDEEADTQILLNAVNNVISGQQALPNSSLALQAEMSEIGLNIENANSALNGIQSMLSKAQEGERTEALIAKRDQVLADYKAVKGIKELELAAVQDELVAEQQKFADEAKLLRAPLSADNQAAVDTVTGLISQTKTRQEALLDMSKSLNIAPTKRNEDLTLVETQTRLRLTNEYGLRMGELGRLCVQPDSVFGFTPGVNIVSLSKSMAEQGFAAPLILNTDTSDNIEAFTQVMFDSAGMIPSAFSDADQSEIQEEIEAITRATDTLNRAKVSHRPILHDPLESLRQKKGALATDMDKQRQQLESQAIALSDQLQQMEIAESELLSAYKALQQEVLLNRIGTMQQTTIPTAKAALRDQILELTQRASHTVDLEKEVQQLKVSIPRDLQSTSAVTQQGPSQRTGDGGAALIAQFETAYGTMDSGIQDTIKQTINQREIFIDNQENYERKVTKIIGDIQANQQSLMSQQSNLPSTDTQALKDQQTVLSKKFGELTELSQRVTAPQSGDSSETSSVLSSRMQTLNSDLEAIEKEVTTNSAGTISDNTPLGNMMNVVQAMKTLLIELGAQTQLYQFANEQIEMCDETIRTTLDLAESKAGRALQGEYDVAIVAYEQAIAADQAQDQQVAQYTRNLSDNIASALQRRNDLEQQCMDLGSSYQENSDERSRLDEQLAGPQMSSLQAGPLLGRYIAVVKDWTDCSNGIDSNDPRSIINRMPEEYELVSLNDALGQVAQPTNKQFQSADRYRDKWSTAQGVSEKEAQIRDIQQETASILSASGTTAQAQADDIQQFEDAHEHIINGIESNERYHQDIADNLPILKQNLADIAADIAQLEADILAKGVSDKAIADATRAKGEIPGLFGNVLNNTPDSIRNDLGDLVKNQKKLAIDLQVFQSARYDVSAFTNDLQLSINDLEALQGNSTLQVSWSILMNEGKDPTWQTFNNADEAKVFLTKKSDYESRVATFLSDHAKATQTVDEQKAAHNRFQEKSTLLTQLSDQMNAINNAPAPTISDADIQSAEDGLSHFEQEIQGHKGVQIRIKREIVAFNDLITTAESFITPPPNPKLNLELADTVNALNTYKNNLLARHNQVPIETKKTISDQLDALQETLATYTGCENQWESVIHGLANMKDVLAQLNVTAQELAAQNEEDSVLLKDKRAAIQEFKTNSQQFAELKQAKLDEIKTKITEVANTKHDQALPEPTVLDTLTSPVLDLNTFKISSNRKGKWGLIKDKHDRYAGAARTQSAQINQAITSYEKAEQVVVNEQVRVMEGWVKTLPLAELNGLLKNADIDQVIVPSLLDKNGQPYTPHELAKGLSIRESFSQYIQTQYGDGATLNGLSEKGKFVEKHNVSRRVNAEYYIPKEDVLPALQGVANNRLNMIKSATQVVGVKKSKRVSSPLTKAEQKAKRQLDQYPTAKLSTYQSTYQATALQITVAPGKATQAQNITSARPRPASTLYSTTVIRSKTVRRPEQNVEPQIRISYGQDMQNLKGLIRTYNDTARTLKAEIKKSHERADLLSKRLDGCKQGTPKHKAVNQELIKVRREGEAAIAAYEKLGPDYSKEIKQYDQHVAAHKADIKAYMSSMTQHLKKSAQKPDQLQAAMGAITRLTETLIEEASGLQSEWVEMDLTSEFQQLQQTITQIHFNYRAEFNGSDSALKNTVTYQQNLLTLAFCIQHKVEILGIAHILAQLDQLPRTSFSGERIRVAMEGAARIPSYNDIVGPIKANSQKDIDQLRTNTKALNKAASFAEIEAITQQKVNRVDGLLLYGTKMSQMTTAAILLSDPFIKWSDNYKKDVQLVPMARDLSIVTNFEKGVRIQVGNKAYIPNNIRVTQKEGAYRVKYDEDTLTANPEILMQLGHFSDSHSMEIFLKRLGVQSAKIAFFNTTNKGLVLHELVSWAKANPQDMKKLDIAEMFFQKMTENDILGNSNELTPYTMSALVEVCDNAIPINMAGNYSKALQTLYFAKLACQKGMQSANGNVRHIALNALGKFNAEWNQVMTTLARKSGGKAQFLQGTYRLMDLSHQLVNQETTVGERVDITMQILKAKENIEASRDELIDPKTGSLPKELAHLAAQATMAFTRLEPMLSKIVEAKILTNTDLLNKALPLAAINGIELPVNTSSSNQWTNLGSGVFSANKGSLVWNIYDGLLVDGRPLTRPPLEVTNSAVYKALYGNKKIPLARGYAKPNTDAARFNLYRAKDNDTLFYSPLNAADGELVIQRTYASFGDIQFMAPKDHPPGIPQSILDTHHCWKVVDPNIGSRIILMDKQAGPNAQVDYAISDDGVIRRAEDGAVLQTTNPDALAIKVMRTIERELSNIQVWQPPGNTPTEVLLPRLKERFLVNGTQLLRVTQDPKTGAQVNESVTEIHLKDGPAMISLENTVSHAKRTLIPNVKGNPPKLWTYNGSATQVDRLQSSSRVQQWEVAQILAEDGGITEALKCLSSTPTNRKLTTEEIDWINNLATTSGSKPVQYQAMVAMIVFKALSQGALYNSEKQLKALNGFAIYMVCNTVLKDEKNGENGDMYQALRDHQWATTKAQGLGVLVEFGDCLGLDPSKLENLKTIQGYTTNQGSRLSKWRTINKELGQVIDNGGTPDWKGHTDQLMANWATRSLNETEEEWVMSLSNIGSGIDHSKMMLQFFSQLLHRNYTQALPSQQIVDAAKNHFVAVVANYGKEDLRDSASTKLDLKMLVQMGEWLSNNSQLEIMPYTSDPIDPDIKYQNDVNRYIAGKTSELKQNTGTDAPRNEGLLTWAEGYTRTVATALTGIPGWTSQTNYSQAQLKGMKSELTKQGALETEEKGRIEADMKAILSVAAVTSNAQKKEWSIDDILKIVLREEEGLWELDPTLVLHDQDRQRVVNLAMRYLIVDTDHNHRKQCISQVDRLIAPPSVFQNVVSNEAHTELNQYLDRPRGYRLDRLLERGDDPVMQKLLLSFMGMEHANGFRGTPEQAALVIRLVAGAVDDFQYLLTDPSSSSSQVDIGIAGTGSGKSSQAVPALLAAHKRSILISPLADVTAQEINENTKGLVRHLEVISIAPPSKSDAKRSLPYIRHLHSLFVRDAGFSYAMAPTALKSLNNLNNIILHEKNKTGAGTEAAKLLGEIMVALKNTTLITDEADAVNAATQTLRETYNDAQSREPSNLNQDQASILSGLVDQFTARAKQHRIIATPGSGYRLMPGNPQAVTQLQEALFNDMLPTIHSGLANTTVDGLMKQDVGSLNNVTLKDLFTALMTGTLVTAQGRGRKLSDNETSFIEETLFKDVMGPNNPQLKQIKEQVLFAIASIKSLTSQLGQEVDRHYGVRDQIYATGLDGGEKTANQYSEIEDVAFATFNSLMAKGITTDAQYKHFIGYMAEEYVAYLNHPNPMIVSIAEQINEQIEATASETSDIIKMMMTPAMKQEILPELNKDPAALRVVWETIIKTGIPRSKRVFVTTPNDMRHMVKADYGLTATGDLLQEYDREVAEDTSAAERMDLLRTNNNNRTETLTAVDDNYDSQTLFNNMATRVSESFGTDHPIQVVLDARKSFAKSDEDMAKAFLQLLNGTNNRIKLDGVVIRYVPPEGGEAIKKVVIPKRGNNGQVTYEVIDYKTLLGRKDPDFDPKKQNYIIFGGPKATRGFSAPEVLQMNHRLLANCDMETLSQDELNQMMGRAGRMDKKRGQTHAMYEFIVPNSTLKTLQGLAGKGLTRGNLIAAAAINSQKVLRTNHMMRETEPVLEALFLKVAGESRATNVEGDYSNEQSQFSTYSEDAFEAYQTVNQPPTYASLMTKLKAKYTEKIKALNVTQSDQQRFMTEMNKALNYREKKLKEQGLLNERMKDDGTPKMTQEQVQEQEGQEQELELDTTQEAVTQVETQQEAMGQTQEQMETQVQNQQSLDIFGDSPRSIEGVPHAERPLSQDSLFGPMVPITAKTGGKVVNVRNAQISILGLNGHSKNVFGHQRLSQIGGSAFRFEELNDFAVSKSFADLAESDAIVATPRYLLMDKREDKKNGGNPIKMVLLSPREASSLIDQETLPEGLSLIDIQERCILKSDDPSAIGKPFEWSDWIKSIGGRPQVDSEKERAHNNVVANYKQAHATMMSANRKFEEAKEVHKAYNDNVGRNLEDNNRGQSRKKGEKNPENIFNAASTAKQTAENEYKKAYQAKEENVPGWKVASALRTEYDNHEATWQRILLFAGRLNQSDMATGAPWLTDWGNESIQAIDNQRAYLKANGLDGNVSGLHNRDESRTLTVNIKLNINKKRMTAITYSLTKKGQRENFRQYALVEVNKNEELGGNYVGLEVRDMKPNPSNTSYKGDEYDIPLEPLPIYLLHNSYTNTLERRGGNSDKSDGWAKGYMKAQVDYLKRVSNGQSPGAVPTVPAPVVIPEASSQSASSQPSPQTTPRQIPTKTPVVNHSNNQGMMNSQSEGGLPNNSLSNPNATRPSKISVKQAGSVLGANQQGDAAMSATRRLNTLGSAPGRSGVSIDDAKRTAADLRAAQTGQTFHAPNTLGGVKGHAQTPSSDQFYTKQFAQQQQAAQHNTQFVDLQSVDPSKLKMVRPGSAALGGRNRAGYQ
ncbi:hypothetical protein HOH87_07715, partial [bacterium]|nr:hypothetical protein [bacterium]